MFREQVTCKGCGATFESHQRSRIYCSFWCRIVFKMALNGTCSPCGSRSGDIAFMDVHLTEFAQEHERCRREFFDTEGRENDCPCVECKRSRGIITALPVKPEKLNRRATTHQQHRQLVLDRDAYVCQICLLPTDPTASPSDDRYPTIDHTIEVYEGGDDDPDNLRTAHRWCNSARNGIFGDGWIAVRAQEKFK